MKILRLVTMTVICALTINAQPTLTNADIIWLDESQAWRGWLRLIFDRPEK